MNTQTLRKTADTLTAQIEAKRNPGVSNQAPTPRRARIAENMGRDADRLAKIQFALYKIADAYDVGLLPDILHGFKTRKAIETLLSWNNFPTNPINSADAIEVFRKADIRTSEEFTRAKDVLNQFIGDYKRPRDPNELIKAAERELIGVKIPGFFPTPQPLAEKVVELADIEENMYILEPSAGIGSLADEIKRQVPTAKIDCIELQSRLVKILELKKHTTFQDDFMEFVPGIDQIYDRVVMNPPFEDSQDIEHVRRAFGFLAPGGRLVSIMGEGAFFRSDRKATEFREWLQSVGGTSERIESGAFTGKDALRQTGVATRIVVIDKPRG